MAKGCALSNSNLPRGGLPRNSVYRITDRPHMTSAVDRGREALTQHNCYSTFYPVHRTKPTFILGYIKDTQNQTDQKQQSCYYIFIMLMLFHNKF